VKKKEKKLLGYKNSWHYFGKKKRLFSEKKKKNGKKGGESGLGNRPGLKRTVILLDFFANPNAKKIFWGGGGVFNKGKRTAQPNFGGENQKRSWGKGRGGGIINPTPKKKK